MQLHFNSVSEPTQAGSKWRKLFKAYWPAYQAWLNSKQATNTPDLKTSQAALKYYMPEMVPGYERLCQLVNADEVAARFLTGFQPPAYISACSQAVRSEGGIQMVRNYDYHPDLIEGTLLLSAWNGKKVMANSDCLIGVLDGMNEDGLVVSLTFGGRKVVGKGFGIPFILRYVLEFCSCVEEAVEVLRRIPSHMSYNVTVIDKSGAFKTVMLAPDRAPIVSDAAFTTNHQLKVDWPENAQFNRTIERSELLEDLLAQNVSADNLSDAFLQAPLYNTRFTEGFGTLYTAVYRPAEGSLQLRWPNENMLQSFTSFREEYKLINFNQPDLATTWETPAETATEATSWPPKPSSTSVAPATDWQETVAETLAKAMAQANPGKEKGRRKTLREQIIYRGQISWKNIADYWSNIGKAYWKK
jgi:predicted choloylglycine hydrolase